MITVLRQFIQIVREGFKVTLICGEGREGASHEKLSLLEPTLYSNFFYLLNILKICLSNKLGIH